MIKTKCDYEILRQYSALTYTVHCIPKYFLIYTTETHTHAGPYTNKLIKVFLVALYVDMLLCSFNIADKASPDISHLELGCCRPPVDYTTEVSISLQH